MPTKSPTRTSHISSVFLPAALAIRSPNIFRRSRSPAFALLVCSSMALLFAAHQADAGTITYHIVDYPAAELDVVTAGGYQDSASGTITATATDLLTSFTAGSHTPPSDPSLVTISYDITLSSAVPGLPVPSIHYTGTDTLDHLLGSGTVTFTSTDILLGGYIALSHSDFSSFELLYWRPDINAYMGYLTLAGTGTEFKWDPADPLTLIGSAPWTIATVPEPASGMLFGVALASLGFVRLRRAGVWRRAK